MKNKSPRKSNIEKKAKAKNKVKKIMKAKPKAVTRKAPKSIGHSTREPIVHKPVAAATPINAAAGAGPKGGDSDRGLYVRFDTPTVKAQVKAAAGSMSMNAYIVAATLYCMENSIVLAKAEKSAEDPAIAQPA